ncbi:hypothetical protein INR49_007144 [Caranx melampygus]|nr:hypothetical protein INR49_007144 [Caranx melampygus]
MSKMSELRILVRRRLAVAADEICGLLELTLGGLEEEVRRQRRVLDSVLNPEIRLQRDEDAGVQQTFRQSSDVQALVGPPGPDWSSSPAAQEKPPLSSPTGRS